MEHCQYGRLMPGRSHIHMPATELSAKPVPTLSALNDACRAVSLFSRHRLWSFSRISSPMIKPDRAVENLVLSKPTEGSVARLVSLLVLAIASPAFGDDGNDDRERQHTAFTATGLPPGVTIDPSTGVISGVVDRTAITDGKMTYDAHISIQDINGASGRFSIKIVLPNKLPFAGNDEAVVKSGERAIVSVLENDSDADGDELMILWAESARSNTVSTDGRTLEFTALNNGFEADIVTYAVSDGHGGEVIGQAKILIVN